jgi:predicted PurR-regulated permease PerM
MSMDPRIRFYTIFVAVIILSAIAAVYLTQVFLTTLLLSVFMVYLLDPLYMYLLRFTRSKAVSSIITITIASGVIIYLFLSVVIRLLAEISNLTSSSDAPPYLKESNLALAITDFIGQFFPARIITLLDGLPSDIASYTVTVLKETVSSFIGNLPVYLAQLVLLVFFTYYLFTSGRDIVIGFLEILPEKAMLYHFLRELNLIYNIFFRIHFLIAAVSAIIAIIGFHFLGIPYPVTWGIILGFFGLIPELGPSAIFVPMAIYYLIVNDYAKALELFIFGEVFLVFLPEYVLRPRLVLIGASVHPLLTVLAFTAPIFVIGPSGVIIGPAIYGIALAGYRTILHFRNKSPRQKQLIDFKK